MTSSAVVLLVKVIPLAQFGRWVPVSDMTGVDCGIHGIDIVFDVADLQSSRRCRDYR